MTAELALMRQELQAVLETLCRLDRQAAALEQRLIAIRDENQDVASGLRDVRRELLAHNRAIGARLDRLDRVGERPAAPAPPAMVGGYPKA